jgi:N utilization substance protein A
MPDIVLNEDSMRLISQFERITGASSRDCVIDEKNNRLIFVVNPGQMGLAIGRQGASINKASDQMGKRVEVVEYSADVEQFLRNCFLPAKVASITLVPEGSGDGKFIAQIGVMEEDRGIAIGKEGKNIFKAKKLAMRQHDIADVQILTVTSD